MKTIALFILFALLAVCEHRPESKETDRSLVKNSNIDHSKMESSPGASESPQELQFLDTMTLHHQGAIDMALLANTRAQHPELKKLAQTIIDEQRKEIDQMREWRAKWFGEAKPAINMNFPGMHAGMGGMNLAKLDSLKANEFDLEFLRQMIPHHEGAVEMAKALKSGDSYAELKQLAEAIMSTQATEIQQMKIWQKAWSAQ